MLTHCNPINDIMLSNILGVINHLRLNALYGKRLPLLRKLQQLKCRHVPQLW